MRDMTRTQFALALRRNQLRLELLWIIDTRPDGDRSVSIGIVMDAKKGIHRRATLAKALRERDKMDAKREAAA
jgi:hypothetical protein